MTPNVVYSTTPGTIVAQVREAAIYVRLETVRKERSKLRQEIFRR